MCGLVSWVQYLTDINVFVENDKNTTENNINYFTQIKEHRTKLNKRTLFIEVGHILYRFEINIVTLTKP